jgi:hypothetical protein
MAIVGFEELGHKDSIFSEGENDGISDFFDWGSPGGGGFVCFDDLIVGADSGHNYQATEVPPLPKNRNVTCGRYKEEMLNQLRELAKLEPNLKYENVYAEPIHDFPPLANEQNVQTGNMHSDCKNDADPILMPTNEETIPRWFSDSGEAAKEEFSLSTLFGACGDETSVVPDTQLDIHGGISHSVDVQEGESQHPIATRTVPCFSIPARHELNSQERDSALSRYKEKKKTRRFDRHIRYESRKARAEGRTRIKGRFAKVDR